MGDAIFPQRNGFLGVGLVAPCGVITPTQLLGLGQLAVNLEATACKMTTRQTLVLIIPENRLADLQRGIAELGLKMGRFGEIVRNVKACAGGPDFCMRAQGNAFGLGARLQEVFMDQPVPRDFKMSVAGCFRGCTDPWCADLGAVATGEDRFTVYLGGRGGSRKPLHGQRVATDLTAQGVERLADHVLQRYRNLGLPGERLCHTMARVGLAELLPLPEAMAAWSAPAEDDFMAFIGQS